MIRAIIFAVFVVPIISLVLDKTQKATKKRKIHKYCFCITRLSNSMSYLFIDNGRNCNSFRIVHGI